MTNEDIKLSAELLSKFNLSKTDELMWLSAGLCGLIKDCVDEDGFKRIKELMYKADKVESHSYARGLWWSGMSHYLTMNSNEIAKEIRLDRSTVYKAIMKFKKRLREDKYTKERWDVLKQHVEYGR